MVSDPQDPSISPETALPGANSPSDEGSIGRASDRPVKRPANKLAALDPRCWSDWLTVDRVMLVYGMGRSAAYALKPHVRWASVPGLGLAYYRPSIEAYIESFARPARDLQSEEPTGPRRMRR